MDVYRCWHWTRHDITWFPNNCNCIEKFDCTWLKFQDILRWLWYKINYDTDVTRAMQLDYFKRYNLTK